MGARNTATDYGKVARSLHWIIALLFLAAYCAVYYRHWFTEKDTQPNMTALHLHLSFGITIGVFVLLRVYWRLTNKPPEPLPGPAWQHRAASFAHYALYFFMIAMPVTGYMGTGINADYFGLFEIPKFEDTWVFQSLLAAPFGLTHEAIEEPIDFFHKEIGGEKLVWMLIALHISAALYHHFVKRDQTLMRMLKNEENRS